MRTDSVRQLRTAIVAIVLAAAAACGGESTAGGASGPPPVGVRTVTLAPKPVPDASEFIATIRSLRSATIQPQVDGIVTRIFVRAGDRVRAGQPLVQIDPDKQQATVASLESARAAREADVAFARQQWERMQTLYTAGAVSRQELEQAQTALKTAEAQLAAIEAQIRAGRVELQYYRVTAPAAGIIGDIEVRPGDRVTPSTVITTLDQGRGLEAYLAVPLERAPRLRLGLPVELLDAEGRVVATNPVTFIAPRADDATQTVLVKSLLRETPPGIRVLQYVRARLVWSREPRLAVPVVAVTRVSGAYFCFVAQRQGGGFVARQKAVEVGEIVGDEYVVRGGLSAGDRVIVSGIQKLADGAPVRPEA
ncbi:MAG TPA: efflux RND transporter periplasmic adaptor subunit [Vicinamibacterales bacterium]|nr:efflux RND transporter periplasmic adaptor subunit [Vicinamibacterales bacterium]